MALDDLIQLSVLLNTIVIESDKVDTIPTVLEYYCKKGQDGSYVLNQDSQEMLFCELTLEALLSLVPFLPKGTVESWISNDMLWNLKLDHNSFGILREHYPSCKISFRTFYDIWQSEQLIPKVSINCDESVLPFFYRAASMSSLYNISEELRSEHDYITMMNTLSSMIFKKKNSNMRLPGIDVLEVIIVKDDIKSYLNPVTDLYKNMKSLTTTYGKSGTSIHVPTLLASIDDTVNGRIKECRYLGVNIFTLNPAMLIIQ